MSDSNLCAQVRPVQAPPAGKGLVYALLARQNVSQDEEYAKRKAKKGAQPAFRLASWLGRVAAGSMAYPELSTVGLYNNEIMSSSCRQVQACDARCQPANAPGAPCRPAGIRAPATWAVAAPALQGQGQGQGRCVIAQGRHDRGASAPCLA